MRVFSDSRSTRVPMRLLTPCLLSLLILLCLAPASAQQRATSGTQRGGGPEPGSCQTGTAEKDLSISDVAMAVQKSNGDVEATLFDTGSLFFGSTAQAAYVVPKNSGKSPLFAAGIWIGGHVNGDLRVAGATYSDFEFWPGPLDPDTGRPVNPSDCSGYDRIWRVSVLDVEAYEQGDPPTPDLEDWPVGLGAPAVDADGNPVVPTSLDQVIDLEAGERPVIYGSEVAFWVMNDVGNQHENFNTNPIGLEVRVSAFAISDPDEPAFDQGTFYRYEVVNRNDQPLEDAYFSFFADPDLGDASDDYAGSDEAREMAYVYNADNVDGGSSGYGTPPPALGFDLLSGASSAMYLISGGPPGTSDPANAAEADNVMQGLWTTGAPRMECGIGISCSGTQTLWAFNGIPEAGTGWTEVGENTTPGDRRVVVSSPTFTLAPGASRTFDLAIVFAFGDDNLDSVAALREASDAVQAAYDDGVLVPLASEPDGTALPATYALSAVYPNPFRARATVSYDLPKSGRVRLAVYDLLGREVAVLADGPAEAGRHAATLNGSALASGLYVVVLTGEDGARATAKITLLR